MGNPDGEIFSSRSDAATASGFPPSNKRKMKQTLFINAAVALGAVMVYQGLCSFTGSSLGYIHGDSSELASTSLERRGQAAERDTTNQFWDQLTPTAQLKWHDCYGQLKCALMETPLDYWNGTEGKAAAAIAMLPAKVPVTDPRYGGPILVNPGGPGGSGVEYAVSYGPQIQTIADSPAKPSNTMGKDARYYDIVGIDPRGIGHSRPLASCFQNNLKRAEWVLRQSAVGVPGASNNVIADLWARSKAYSDSCNKFARSKDTTEDIEPFITTASTARDMVTFTDRFSEWREREARRIHRGKVPKSLRSNSGQEKLQYWGVSYGSFLGQTLASMYPERIGRMIVDGIVDVDDYTKALWINNLVDSEKTLDWFYSSCIEAGQEKCALAKPGSTAADVRKRTEAVLHHLHRHSVVSPKKIPDVLTWSDAQTTMFNSMYSPSLFSSLADYIVGLEGVDSSPLAGSQTDAHYPVPGKTSEQLSAMDSKGGIICGDADVSHYENFTLEDVHARYKVLYKLSPTMAPNWLFIGISCAVWHRRAEYRFPGPFGTSANSGAAPLFFIGNTADPVTPLPNAVKMAKRFHGSHVVTLDTPGHTSWASPSTCLMRQMRAYLHTGAMPKDGLVCQPNQTPFGEPRSVGGQDQQEAAALGDLGVSVEADDAALLSAHQSLRDYFAGQRYGLGL